MAELSFAEQIKPPNWQRRRLEIMESAAFCCQNCGTDQVTLNVHHKQYVKGRMYWEYADTELEFLCEDCHQREHAAQDALRTLLAQVCTADALAFIAGFHFHSDWVDPENVAAGREANPLAHAAGFVGWMAYNLDIDQMDKVAAFAASLMKEAAEARLVYEHDSAQMFGRG
jgi:hypothetical protein